MTFADQVSADLTVFTNPVEFGSVRLIGLDGQPGTPIACDLQDEALVTERGAGDGVYLSESTLYVRASDLIEPVVTQRLSIDGRVARVARVVVEQGMLVIGLQWSES